MNSFYAYLGRMKNIERWALMRNTSKENILEHSAQVAHLAHGIALIAKKEFSMDVDANEVATKALFHEVSEVITGDLPTPIKYYNSEINKAYKSIEDKATRQIISTLPDMYREDYLDITMDKTSLASRIVKYADRLAAYIKCLEEVNSGNKEFEKAKETIYAVLEENMQEFAPLKVFMDRYIDSFSATLDELR